MAGRVDVDPGELERFAAQLKAFNQELEQITYKIEGQFQSLGSSWRDSQYEKFEASWHQTFRAIYKYIDSDAPEHIRILVTKARILSEYQRRS